MRRFLTSFPILILAAVAAAALATPRVLAADGSVTGTVTATGLSTSADIVVSLEAPGLTVKPPAAPVEMDQKGQKFIPHVLTVVKGTTVKFLNSDPFAHNVFSPEGKYDLGSWKEGATKDHQFARAGVYTQLCRIHPEMEAFVVVLDTPYFAKTDASGAFHIDNVPPGHYTLVAWSEKLKTAKEPVTVEAGKPAAVHVMLHK